MNKFAIETSVKDWNTRFEIKNTISKLIPGCEFYTHIHGMNVYTDTVLNTERVELVLKLMGVKE